MLDGPCFRLALAVQDIRCHVSGLDAQFVIIYGKGGQSSVFGHDFSACEDRNLVGIRNLDQVGHGGGYGIIGGHINDIHFPHEGFGHLLDVVDGMNGPFFHGEAMFFAVTPEHIGLDFGIDFASRIDEAYFFRIRHEGEGQLHLGLDGGQVGYAGHIAAGSVIGLHQFGRDVVGNAGPHDGDIPDFIGHGLGGRSRNGADEFRLFRSKAGGDGFQVGLVPLGILLVEMNFVFRVAPFFHTIHEAFIGKVQRPVFHELYHGYNRFSRRGSRG